MQEASIAIIAPLQPDDFFDLLWQGVWEATFDLAAFGVQVRNLTTQRYDVAGQQEILTQQSYSSSSSTSSTNKPSHNY